MSPLKFNQLAVDGLAAKAAIEGLHLFFALVLRQYWLIDDLGLWLCLNWLSLFHNVTIPFKDWYINSTDMQNLTPLLSEKPQ